VADATAGLVTNKRSIESNVVVDDGDILVLGGLMQDNFQNNQDKVPGLGSIPGLGALFRNENRTRTKSNLMVFLRPVVMRSAEQSNTLSMDRYDQIRGQQQEAQPPSRPLLPDIDAPVLPARGAGSKSPAGSVPVPAPTTDAAPVRP
jgi:general secretion pathway protein D